MTFESFDEECWRDDGYDASGTDGSEHHINSPLGELPQQGEQISPELQYDSFMASSRFAKQQGFINESATQWGYSGKSSQKPSKIQKKSWKESGGEQVEVGPTANPTTENEELKTESETGGVSSPDQSEGTEIHCDSPSVEDETPSTSNQASINDDTALSVQKESDRLPSLIERARDNDREAFEEIYFIYHRRVYNTAYTMVWNYDDAEDITQDVFARLLEVLPKLRHVEAFSAFVYRTTFNMCLRRIARRKKITVESIEKESELEDDSDVLKEFFKLGVMADAADSVVLRKELRFCVRSAIDMLSEGQKEVITLHFFSDMGYQEISDFLNIEMGTVKSRMSRAYDKLHDFLLDYYMDG